jgi:hypothetical protein
MPDPPRYWFPAKRYGWGWGPPATWQGQLILVLFLIAQIALGVTYLPHRVREFALGTIVLVCLLVAICYLKGEPPSWRWGDPDP